MRRALAVNAGALETDDQDRMKRLSEQHLRSSKEPAPRGGLSWGIEGDERLHLFRVARLGSAIDPRGDRETALTAQSGIGHFLRSPGTWAGLPDQKKLPAKDFPVLARSLIDVLARNGFLEPYGGKEFREAKDGAGQPIIYRLRMARLGGVSATANQPSTSRGRREYRENERQPMSSSRTSMSMLL